MISDSILKEFSASGPLALAFAILLGFVLKLLLDERKQSYEERKGMNEERVKTISVLQQMSASLIEITNTQKLQSRTQEMQQQTLASLADDVKDIQRWRDGQGHR